jgi:50S ribosomal subunit-associated GTPase HflX
MSSYPNELFISALKGFQVNALKEVLFKKILSFYSYKEFKVDYCDAKTLSFIYENAYVSERVNAENYILLKTYIDSKILNKMFNYEY